jgi:hypothetical protein
MPINPPDDSQFEADLAVLGLQRGATLADIQREYRHRHGLYSPQSLAAYGLIEDGERADRLEQLELAYRRLLEIYDQARMPLAPSGRVDAPKERVDTTADVNTNPGAYLLEVRTARGLTLEDLSIETKIRKAIIEHVEAERYQDLPQVVFVRGFVVQIARALGESDPEMIAKTYVELMQSSRAE